MEGLSSHTGGRCLRKPSPERTKELLRVLTGNAFHNEPHIAFCILRLCAFQYATYHLRATRYSTAVLEWAQDLGLVLLQAAAAATSLCSGSGGQSRVDGCAQLALPVCLGGAGLRPTARVIGGAFVILNGIVIGAQALMEQVRDLAEAYHCALCVGRLLESLCETLEKLPREKVVVAMCDVGDDGYVYLAVEPLDLVALPRAEPLPGVLVSIGADHRLPSFYREAAGGSRGDGVRWRCVPCRSLGVSCVVRTQLANNLANCWASMSVH